MKRNADMSDPKLLQAYDDWVKDHFDELVTKYAGKYVGVHRRGLLAVGDSYEKIHAIAKKKRIKEPILTMQVPTDEDLTAILQVSWQRSPAVSASKPIVFRYALRGGLLCPIITAGIRVNKTWHDAEFYVDSGATYTIMHSQFAGHLQFDYTTGRRILVQVGDGSWV